MSTIKPQNNSLKKLPCGKTHPPTNFIMTLSLVILVWVHYPKINFPSTYNAFGNKFHCRTVNGKHDKMQAFARLCADSKYALTNTQGSVTLNGAYLCPTFCSRTYLEHA